MTRARAAGLPPRPRSKAAPVLRGPGCRTSRTSHPAEPLVHSGCFPNRAAPGSPAALFPRGRRQPTALSAQRSATALRVIRRDLSRLRGSLLADAGGAEGWNENCCSSPKAGAKRFHSPSSSSGAAAATTWNHRIV